MEGEEAGGKERGTLGEKKKYLIMLLLIICLAGAGAGAKTRSRRVCALVVSCG
jgi:hypothetical protein